MLIRRASAADKEELKALWQVVFNEEQGFLEDFFSLRFAPDNIFLIETDGIIVSALHALAVQFLDVRQGTIDASYIVGAATLDAYRKRGYMEELLKQVREQSEGPVLLYPAVRAYYEKHGFSSCSSSTVYDLRQTSYFTQPPSQEIPQVNVGRTVPDMKELNEAYEASIACNGGLLRDTVAWKFILDGFGSDIIQIQEDSNTAYALIREGQAVEVAASTLQAGKELLAELGARQVTGIKTIQGSIIDELLSVTNAPFTSRLEGMSFPDIENNPYIGEQY